MPSILDMRSIRNEVVQTNNANPKSNGIILTFEDNMTWRMGYRWLHYEWSEELNANRFHEGVALVVNKSHINIAVWVNRIFTKMTF